MSSVRALTYLIFAYTTVEGLVINIMYPNTLPFIFKDVAILLAYVALASETHGSNGSLSRVSGALFLFGLVMCFFLVMPSQVALFGELVALKQRLFYIPLIWVGYHFLRDVRDLRLLLKVMAWTAIPASLFGIYLYFVGPAGLMTLGANYSAVFNSTAGEHGISFWRVPGTFTSPGQYGGFLLVNSVVFVGVLFDSTVEAGQRRLTILALLVSLGALMVSGSRSPLLLFMMCSVVMLTVTGRLKGIGVWAGGLYSALALGFSLFGDGVQDRVGSIASWEHVTRFEDTYFGQLFWPLLMQNPMGFGLGRATIGARHFTEWSNIMLVESYFGIIVAETGFMGVIAFSAALLAILALLWKCHTVIRSAPNNVLWYAIVLPVLVTVAVSPVSSALDAAPDNLYFWFFLGTAIKWYDLELAARQGRLVSTYAAPPAVYPTGSSLGYR